MYKAPLKRSKLRVYLWRKYYTLLKYWKWFKARKKLAKTFSDKELEYVVFEHKSLIPRKLLWVDMQLQYNKFTNLSLAIKNINGLIIKSWEVFSYWKQIGNPTKRKGYIEWVVLNNGKYKAEIGGWLCQLSNLLFWMFLHTELDVIERHRHSYDVFPDVKRKVPFWTWATCYYPFLDLQVQNNTDALFQIVLYIQWDYLYWKILSDKKPIYNYKIVEENHRFENYWNFFLRHNEIYREIYKKNKLLKKEFLFKNNAYMMYNPTLVYNEK